LVAACYLASFAQGERTQRGNLIVALDGHFSPLTLPRDRPAPVSVRLDASLQTADGSVLPRVTRVELGIPGQGVITTRGLPTCQPRRLRDATTEKALEACRPALVGRGRMLAQVKIPHQDPFTVRARLVAFDGRVNGERAVIVHGVSAEPPTSVVLPFLFRLRPGRFGTVLVAHLPARSAPGPVSPVSRWTSRGATCTAAASSATSARPARSRDVSPPASSPSPRRPSPSPAAAR